MRTTLTAAFANPVLSAQATFRRVMDATAHPGTVVGLSEPIAPPPPLSRGAAAVVLTLCDQDTPVWLDQGLADAPDVVYWLRFHTGAPIVARPKQAAFAILSDPQQVPPFDRFSLGTAEYPDRSATLILQVESLERGTMLKLAGPGIKDRTILCASPVPVDLSQRLAANRALFPRGVDLLLVTDSDIAAIARSVGLIEEA